MITYLFVTTKAVWGQVLAQGYFSATLLVGGLEPSVTARLASGEKLQALEIMIIYRRNPWELLGSRFDFPKLI